MEKLAKRATVYFSPAIHAALRIKAAATEKSMSDIINEAVKRALAEDAIDLAAFTNRVNEPDVSYEAVLKDLKKHGRI